MTKNTIVTGIERQTFVEQAADPIHRKVSELLDGAPALKSALHGDWLGHSLHAALTDIPVGAWTAGVVLDVVSTRDRRYRRAADAVHTIGLVGSLASAVTGLTDWTYVEGDAKRLGFVHGALNVVIAGLFAGSLAARAKKRRGAGVVLSSVGYGLALFSQWLGGELTYHEGANVQRLRLPKHEERTEERIAERREAAL
jgi:uncharacterized membrane protein